MNFVLSAPSQHSVHKFLPSVQVTTGIYSVIFIDYCVF